MPSACAVGVRRRRAPSLQPALHEPSIRRSCLAGNLRADASRTFRRETSERKPPTQLGSFLRGARRYALHQAIGSLLEDYSLVSFVPLDISTVRLRTHTSSVHRSALHRGGSASCTVYCIMLYNIMLHRGGSANCTA